MPREKEFEAHIERLVGREAEPRKHSKHPDLGVMLAALGGELTPEVRGKFTAHIATCSPCAARWRELAGLLEGEESSLAQQARVPSFGELVRQQSLGQKEALGQRLSAWVKTLAPRPALRPAFSYAATAVTAVAVTLAVAVPLLRGPATPDDGLLAITKEDSDVLISVPSGVLKPIDVGSQELTVLIKEMREIDDPWQKSLYLAGELSRYGIFIPDELDLTKLELYAVQDGDTWAGIAGRELGERDLWPLLVLLNAERVDPDRLDPGIQPTVDKLSIPTRLGE